MAKYRVETTATASVYLGVFEADTKEEAVEKALNKYGCDTVPLCWECAQKVGELFLSDKEEDIEVDFYRD